MTSTMTSQAGGSTGNRSMSRASFTMAIATLFMALMLTLTGCGAGASKPSTLEEYYTTVSGGQDELNQIASDYAANVYQATGFPTSAEAIARGNQLRLIAYFQLTEDQMLGEGLLSLLTGQGNTAQQFYAELISESIDGQTVVSIIRNVENELGISGITIRYECRDANAKLLAAAEYDDTGRIA